MQQHASILTVTIEGDYEKGRQYVADAQKVVDQLQQRLTLGGVSSGADWKDLGGGAWLYARVAMGVNAVRIVVPASEDREPEKRTEIVKDSPPDFMSGIVSGGYIEEKEIKEVVRTGSTTGQVSVQTRTIEVLKDYWPTEQSQRKHGIRGGWQESERLAIEDDPLLSVNAPSFMDSGKRSQHHGIKPTMYSGTMKKVVQLLLGYGRQNAELYRYELWGVELPEQPKAKKRKPVAVADRVRYDFRAYRTHGIVFAANGMPWLIEVSGHNGVIGMPFELHPDSVTAEFRQYLESKGDIEALQVIEFIKGFPTGKAFPEGSSLLRAMISAGMVVRLATPEQMRPFYSNNPYSSAMGWAFNESGTEAHNTCWNWDEATDYQFGEHYSLSFSIGQPINVEPPKDGAKLLELLSGVSLDGMGRDEREAFAVHMQKVKRLNNSQVSELLGMGAKAAYDALKEMDAVPIATARALLSRVSRGALMAEGYDTEYQIKFWEPLLKNAIITHNFQALSEIEDRPPKGPSPNRCDTTMLVFFAGDQLKTVKWFWDTRRKTVSDVDTDEEDCMFAGKWTYTRRSGTVGPAPGYYSHDYDYRVEVPDTTYRRLTEGADLGWIRCTADWPNDWPVGGWCSAGRTRGFRMRTETFTSIEQESVCAVVWPAFAREAYYIVERTRTITSGYSLGHSYKELTDPNGMSLWIDHYGFNSQYLRTHPKGCSNPNGRRVVEPTRSTSPGCAEIIDEGPWASECDQIDGYLFNTPLPPLPAGINQARKLEVKYRGHFVSGYGDAADLDTEADTWFEPSPPLDAPDSYQFMYATGNVLGRSECVVFSKGPSQALDTAGVFRIDRLTAGVPCFIGVVQ